MGNQTSGGEKLAWYCLSSQPKHERIAAEHLRKQAEVEVFAPLIRYQSLRGKHKIWNTEAMFPGYLFARFDFQTRAREIRSAHGIRGIVHFGEVFPSLPDELLAQLREAIGEEGVAVIVAKPMPGSEVTITDGALNGVRALVTQYFPSKERVRVLLEMLGRGVEIDLPSDSVATDKPRHPLG